MYWKNKKRPEISVIIPTFKRPHLLIRCVNALISQTLNGELYEIIVVDDGRDSTTKIIVKKLSEKINISLRFFSTKGQLGPAAARNTGSKHARGKVLAFTDDDTIPDSNWLKAGFKKMKEGNKVLTGKILVPVSEEPSDYELNVKKLETAEFVTANLFILKKILRNLGGFDEKFEAAYREDSDLHFSLLENNISITYSEKIVIEHPVRKSFWASSLIEQKKNMYSALLFKKHPGLFRQKIRQHAPLSYYITSLSLLSFPVSASLGNIYLLVAAYSLWAILLNRFILKRLKHSSHSMENVIEIIITSLLIPPLSIFWRIYGAFRYRVFFV